MQPSQIKTEDDLNDVPNDRNVLLKHTLVYGFFLTVFPVK
jgi:hypothetical protein